MPTFDLIVEGDYSNAYTVPEPKLKLERLEWNGDSPPDVIVLPQGTVLVKVARYLKQGNEYCYRIANIAMLENGQLKNYSADKVTEEK